MKRTARYSFFLLFLLTICNSSVYAQSGATVNARIDATSITVGDQIRLFIEATSDTTAGTLKWAQIPDTFNHLEVVERSNIDTSMHGQVAVYKQRLLITGFDSGMFQIPSFAFPVVAKTGSPYYVVSDSFYVSVSTVPVDTTKPFEPIKDIIEVKATWKDYIWLILGGVVFLALIAFVIWYFRKHKKSPIPQFVPKAPVETPQERALRKLSDLEQQQLWQNERVKEYYSGLTEILRSYIEELYRVPAMEQTSDELLQDARKHPQMNPHAEELAKILSTADMAKFAKAKPLPQDHVACLDATKKFIHNTRAVTETIEKQA